MLAKALVAVLLIPAWAFTAWSQPVHTVKPVLATESVSADADDPAIWVHPTDPTLSLLIGTNRRRPRRRIGAVRPEWEAPADR